MKDMLSRAVWWNAPVYNPTQVRYRRFKRTPGGEMPNMLGGLEDKMNALKDTMKDRIKRSEEPK